MTVIGAINSALTSVRALGTSVSVLSDNIGQASSETHNRRTSSVEALVYGGVKVSGIRRAVNDGLRDANFSANAAQNFWSTKQQFVDNYEALMGSLGGDTPLVRYVADFEQAWRLFQATPEVQSIETTVVARANAVVSEVRRLSSGLDQIEAQVNREIENEVTKFNNALLELTSINARISRSFGSSQSIATLENLAEKQIEILSGSLDFNLRRNQNMTYQITATNFSITTIPPYTLSYNSGSQALSREINSRDDIRNAVPGGRLESLVQLVSRQQAEVNSEDRTIGFVSKLRSDLDEVVRNFTDDYTSKIRLRTIIGDPNTGGGGNVIANLTGLQTGTIDLTLTPSTGGAATTTSITIGATTTVNELVNSINTTVAGVTARANTAGQLELFTAQGTLSLSDNGPATGLLGNVTANTNFLIENAPSFANIYRTSATRTGANEVETFFTGISTTDIDRNNFQVNANLQNHTGRLKRSAAAGIVDGFNARTRVFNSTAYSVENVNYTQAITGLSNNILETGRRVEERAEQETEIRTQMRTTYRNDVGTNIDSEITRLTILQNNHNASARVITAADNMLVALIRS
ncbi:MAG: flagellin hook IN motif-containing protein [Pseudomonadota bacterium]